MTQTFKVGDRVVWESQAAGHSKKKEGVVFKIVPALEFARDYFADGFRTEQEPGKPRNHRSYLIQIGKSKILYWPLVSRLRLVEGNPLEKTNPLPAPQSDLPGMPEKTDLEHALEKYLQINGEVDNLKNARDGLVEDIVASMRKIGKKNIRFGGKVFVVKHYGMDRLQCRAAKE